MWRKGDRKWGESEEEASENSPDAVCFTDRFKEEAWTQACIPVPTYICMYVYFTV